MADRIKQGELRVEYCPTGDMVADYFTKPLQGSLFRRMRDTIMSASGGPASMQLPVGDLNWAPESHLLADSHAVEC